MTIRVLTVCTGNLCRSPLAERLLTQRAAQHGLDVEVSGAGTRARNGLEMHPETQRVLRGYGGDPEGFTSRYLTPQLLREQDLVLTASREHSDAVAQAAPAAWKKTFTLREIALIAERHPDATLAGLHALRSSVVGENLDVADPIGQTPDVFDTTGAQISEAVDLVVVLSNS